LNPKLLTEFFFENYKVATILCDSQESKVNFIYKMISSETCKDKISIYIDIDTFFTVFLEELKGKSYFENLLIFRPITENLDYIIAEICSLNPSLINMVIFDSVSSFYNLQNSDMDFYRLNMKLGLFISMLNSTISSNSGKLIFTSMRRSRKKRDQKSWYNTYSGGKLLRKRSDIIMELMKKTSTLEGVVLKHPNNTLIGKILNFNVEQIQTETKS
jgi:hypothetical protein